MSTLSAKEYKCFEDIKRIRPDGSEYWAARELAPVLDYAKWENFYNVIKRAMIACENSGRSTLECFPEVRKTSPMPNGGVKDILDYELSRYACYLIVQNGDPRKEVIALGQTYFAIQTYRQEVADRFIQLRASPRRAPSGADKLLFGGIPQHRLHGGDLRCFQLYPRLQYVCSGGCTESLSMEREVSGDGVGKSAWFL